MRFSELGITSDVIIGKGIDMDELFGKRILIEKTLIKPSNFPGKNTSGLRMSRMQTGISTRRMRMERHVAKGGHVSPGQTT